MSAIILVGLGVMWAVVLIPMWLRRHDETEEARSVDRFVSAMHTLSRREAKVDPKRYGLVPHQTRDLEVHVSGASADGTKAPRRPNRKPTVTAADRRRRTLYVLLGLAVLTLALAVLLGGLLMWALSLIVDVALVAFVYYSRRCVAASARRRPIRRPTARPTPAARAKPATRARPASRTADRVPARSVPQRRYVDDVPERIEPNFAPVASPAARDVAQESALFDQTIAEDRLARRAPVAAEYEPAAAAAFYDQEAPPVERVVEYDATPRLDRDADTIEIPASELFDQYQEPEVRIIVPERRDVMRDPIQVADTERPAATAGSAGVGSAGVGSAGIGQPWEPVAVPKPSYATKPVAPPRRTRAPIMEPLLPPIETAVELDSPDDLEEILDRRWAVND